LANILDLNLEEPVDIGGKRIPKVAIIAGGAGIIVLVVFVSRGGTLRKPAGAKVAPAQDLGTSGIIYPGSGAAPGQFTLSETAAPADSPVETPVAAAPESVFFLGPVLSRRFKRAVYRLRSGQQASPEELAKLGLRYAPGLSARYKKLGAIFVSTADDPQRKPSKATQPKRRPPIMTRSTVTPVLDTKPLGQAAKV
jgi:hypothetical protein